MPENYKAGQAVIWDTPEMLRYGVILDIFNGVVEFAPVFAIRPDDLCYNDAGANRAKHRHNVRLQDCPPPFMLLCASADSGQCFCDANLDRRQMFSLTEAGLELSIVDDDALVSDRDMAEIFYHPWPEQKECEKTILQDRKLSERLRNPPFRPVHLDKSGCDGPDF